MKIQNILSIKVYIILMLITTLSSCTSNKEKNQETKTVLPGTYLFERTYGETKDGYPLALVG